MYTAKMSTAFGSTNKIHTVQ